MKIGVMYGNPETTTGGVALKFYSSLRIEVRRGSQIREGKEAIGNETKLKVVKNKVAPPFKEAQVDMIYGEGIAKQNDIFNLAVEEGFIQRKGAWFSYVNEDEEEVSLGQGKINSLEYLKEHPELLDYFEYEIRKKKGLYIPEDLEKSINEMKKGKKTATKKEDAQDESDEEK
jgi:recombination protein RecA